jgi:hypothetical protein
LGTNFDHPHLIIAIEPKSGYWEVAIKILEACKLIQNGLNFKA